MDQKEKRFTSLILILLAVWTIVLVISLTTTPSQPQPVIIIDNSFELGENSLTYPRIEPGSYCENWRNTGEMTIWSDRPFAYSATKLSEYGWDIISSNKYGRFLAFKSLKHLSYEDVVWRATKNQDFQETNQALFLIPKNVNFIFSRTYFYSDNEYNNIQTARLGVDYACPGQIFNHIPGASAFCRKDFLQRYILDYRRRYANLGLSHCFDSSLTPKSFILNEPEHCNTLMDELELQILMHTANSMPIEWILKSPLQHKGYGIQLVDYAKAQILLDMYRRNRRPGISCNNIAEEHQHLIGQKYISNPALVKLI